MKKLILFAAVFFCAACTPKAYLSQNFDFNNLHSIGILAFSTPNNALAGAENIFAKNLIRQGYTVVERARIEQILAEQSLSPDSYLSPEVTRKIGKVLGVDALLMGSITSYVPARRQLAYDITRTTVSEPVFTRDVTRDEEGNVINVNTRVAGQQKRKERNVAPREVRMSAQVGVTVKLVDVNTAEILWVGSDTAEGTSGLDALNSSARMLIRSFDNAVRRARARSPQGK